MTGSANGDPGGDRPGAILAVRAERLARPGAERDDLAAALRQLRESELDAAQLETPPGRDVRGWARELLR